MKKIYLFLALICAGFFTNGQTTVTIYAGGGLPAADSITGYADSALGTRVKDTIFSDALERGYAVFNLSSIPAGATVTSVVIGYNISGDSVIFGTASNWKICGIAGDLSIVTNATTLFHDCAYGGAALYTGSWGTSTGNQTQPTNAAAQAFIAANAGAKVSMGFSSSGLVRYTFTGEDGTATTSGVHAPYLQITYTVCHAITPGPSDTVCPGSTLALSDSTGGGSWTSSLTSVATVNDTTGLVTGVTTGVATISYVAGSCIETVTMNVFGPTAISPSGAVTVCTGGTSTLSDGVLGGTWASSNTGVATVSGGIVTGVMAGTATITYTLGGCFVTKIVTVNGPTAITPNPASVCVGGTVTLTDTVGSGVWSLTNSDATIGAGTGVVTGMAVGSDTVRYTVGACSVTGLVNVVSGAAVILPSTPVTVCIGTPTTLTDASSGGTWSTTSTGVATVGVTTGIVNGITPGTAIITYTVGSCFTTKTVTVVAGPAAISPTSASICIGGTVTLTDATSGGAWSSSSGAATVAGGIVSGAASGTAFISYTVGACSSIATVSVNAGPAAIAPSGAISVCTGSITTLTDATPGGTWASSASGTASVSGGVVTGILVGTATITYTEGGCYVTKLVTVTSGAAAISPATATLCTGATVTMSDATSGGAWTSSNTGVATVAGGVVTGAGPGTALISYTVGTCSSISMVTVNATPVAISPSGAIAVCSGLTTTLTDATPGGTWTSGTPGVATVSGGIVTGVGPGTATISYGIGSCYVTQLVTVSGAVSPISPSSATICMGTTATFTDASVGGIWTTGAPGVVTVSGGVATPVATGTALISYTVGTCSATASITVSASPAAILPSSSLICEGTVETLTDATPGGTWSSSSTTVATVDATGDVTGSGPGTATIIYTLGSCTASSIVTVSAAPTAISPATSSVCVGSSESLIESVPGGTWSSASTGTATVSGSGLVTGVNAGNTTITYSIGTCTTTATVTVNPLANPGTITGPASAVCGTGSVLLTDATPGGTWSASNGNATVTAGGLVTGVTVGSDIISYSVTNGCGTVAATFNFSVDGAPTVTPILGPPSICAGSFTIMSDSTAGGTWTASNGNAVFTSGGTLTGITAGLDTILYTVTNACGSVATSKFMTVAPLPDTGVISGANTVCVLGTITLSETVGGGVWGNVTGNASVSATGVVTGVSGGIDTIHYSVTNGCGTLFARWPVTVNALPTAGTITGPATVCQGAVITLTDPAAGGSYSASNGNATVIPATGAVSGITPGIDTITYTNLNTCGSASTTKIITVELTPAPALITGLGAVCIGSTITLNDATPGGTWSATDGNATVNATGVVTGITTGTDSIVYTITNSCGTGVAGITVVIDSIPTAGAISGGDQVCVGTTLTLTDGVAGGTWSASSGAGTISPTGVVTGVSAGVDIISYSVTTTCGTGTTIMPITVNAYPIAGVISGPTTVCQGSSVTLSETIAGGTWSSGSGLATVTSAGIVTGVTAGTDTISYTIINVCATVGTFQIMNVMPLPDAGSISGATSVCLGSTIPLTDGTAGGTWSAANGNATVDASGNVTGVTAGSDIISYTATNSCGTVAATWNVAVVTFPVTGPITGPTSVCTGGSITLSNADAGGVWSTVIGNATINASGDLTGVTTGTDSVYYTITNACGTASSGSLITINGSPTVTAIGGATGLCVGTATLLNDGTAGGTWTSGNTSVATIDAAAGLLTGMSAGVDTVAYTITNASGCTAVATYVDTVYVVPSSTPITGTTSICMGGYSILSNSITGGAWSSSNTGVAVIDPVTGVVTAVSAGTTTINYSVTNMCGSASDNIMVTVSDIPTVMPIAGSGGTICAGATTLLTDGTTGGVWSTSDSTVATVSSGGLVTGNVAGNVTITYSVTNAGGCSNYATYGLTFGSFIGSSSVTPTSGSICGSTPVEMQVITAGGGLTYQWQLNGTNISGATAYDYSATAPGSYDVIISNGSCSETLTGPTITGMTTPSITYTAPNILSVSGSFATYQWYRNGVMIPGATSATYVEAIGGNYTCQVSNGSGCTETTAPYFVTGGVGSGVANVNNNGSVNIYPNPASSMIHINANVSVRTRILSPDGKVVVDVKDQADVDVSSLATGIYIIMIYDQDDLLLHTDKMIKE